MTAWATVPAMKGSGEVKVVNACGSERPTATIRPDTDERKRKLRALKEEVLRTRRRMISVMADLDKNLAAINELLTTE